MINSYIHIIIISVTTNIFHVSDENSMDKASMIKRKHGEELVITVVVVVFVVEYSTQMYEMHQTRTCQNESSVEHLIAFILIYYARARGRTEGRYCACSHSH